MKKAWELVCFACWVPGMVGHMLWLAAFCDTSPPLAWIWMMPFMLLLAPFALANMAVGVVKKHAFDRRRIA